MLSSQLAELTIKVTNRLMRLVRAALLVLLTSTLAGLGVPASFAQTASGSGSKGASSSKPAVSPGSQTVTAVPKKGTAASTVVKSTSATSSGTSAKKSPAKSSVKNSASAAKKASGKSSTSKRARKQPGQKAPTADRVTEIQAALAKDGSFQGSPSGKWDEATAAAMRRFQASHGLNPSGKLDAPTLQRLGLGSQTAGIAAPTPPPGAVSRLTSSANVTTLESRQ
jgi:peptidoglycan hydrolase-like protein with peptidoglycan-binding domain